MSPHNPPHSDGQQPVNAVSPESGKIDTDQISKCLARHGQDYIDTDFFPDLLTISPDESSCFSRPAMDFLLGVYQQYARLLHKSKNVAVANITGTLEHFFSNDRKNKTPVEDIPQEKKDMARYHLMESIGGFRDREDVDDWRREFPREIGLEEHQNDDSVPAGNNSLMEKDFPAIRPKKGEGDSDLDAENARLREQNAFLQAEVERLNARLQEVLAQLPQGGTEALEQPATAAAGGTVATDSEPLQADKAGYTEQPMEGQFPLQSGNAASSGEGTLPEQEVESKNTEATDELNKKRRRVSLKSRDKDAFDEAGYSKKTPFDCVDLKKDWTENRKKIVDPDTGETRPQNAKEYLESIYDPEMYGHLPLAVLNEINPKLHDSLAKLKSRNRISYPPFVFVISKKITAELRDLIPDFDSLRPDETIQLAQDMQRLWSSLMRRAEMEREKKTGTDARAPALSEKITAELRDLIPDLDSLSPEEEIRLAEDMRRLSGSLIKRMSENNTLGNLH